MKFLKRVINNQLTLPSELLDLPTVTITGDEQIKIEQYYKLISFTDKEITLQCESGVIQIKGDSFIIKLMYSREIILEGIIKEITFHN